MPGALRRPRGQGVDARYLAGWCCHSGSGRSRGCIAARWQGVRRRSGSCCRFATRIRSGDLATLPHTSRCSPMTAAEGEGARARTPFLTRSSGRSTICSRSSKPLVGLRSCTGSPQGGADFAGSGARACDPEGCVARTASCGHGEPRPSTDLGAQVASLSSSVGGRRRLSIG